ncbi:MAG TPA: PQQ-binding-like beta-propeller repeat protein, partial [Polyangia bacterium]|nr:PQQ-binding-like beta-propeller repeat protein [Polyangia bacterium]
DDGGNMWAIDPGTGFATPNGLWHYTAGSSISGSPYYDASTDTLQFGTDGGAILSLNGSTGAVVNAGYPYTPTAGDPITAAPLYYKGILVIGSSGGKLYFLDRNTGSSVALIKKYDFGTNEAISGVGYDVSVNRFMVTTANPTTKDGRLYYFDLITDPTNGSN